VYAGDRWATTGGSFEYIICSFTAEFTSSAPTLRSLINEDIYSFILFKHLFWLMKYLVDLLFVLYLSGVPQETELRTIMFQIVDEAVTELSMGWVGSSF